MNSLFVCVFHSYSWNWKHSVYSMACRYQQQSWLFCAERTQRIPEEKSDLQRSWPNWKKLVILSRSLMLYNIFIIVHCQHPCWNNFRTVILFDFVPILTVYTTIVVTKLIYTNDIHSTFSSLSPSSPCLWSYQHLLNPNLPAELSFQQCQI